MPKKPNSKEIYDKISERMLKYFGNKINGDFQVDTLSDDPELSVVFKFEMYEYFLVELRLESGKFCFNVLYDDTRFPLEESPYAWIGMESLEPSFKDLQHKIELRIPDKFLKAKGWKK